MNLAQEWYLKGNYSSSLQELLSMKCDTQSPEECFLLKNNLTLTKILVEILKKEDTKDLENDLEGLFENCVLTFTHLNVGLEIALLILCNRCWCLLAGMDSPSEKDWRRLFHHFFNLCSKIGRGITLSDNQFRFALILKAKNALMKTRHKAIGIFTQLVDCVLIGMLAMLQVSQEVDKLIAVETFIQSYLTDRQEMLAVAGDSGAIAASTHSPVAFMLDLHGSPSLLSHLNLEHALCLMAIVRNTALLLLANYQPVDLVYLQNSRFECLYLHLEALKRLYKGGDEEACLRVALSVQLTGFGPSQPLQAHNHLLLGQIYSNLRERHKALESFSTSLKLNKNCPMTHYYFGSEFGKLGLQSSMLKSYQNSVKALKGGRKVIGKTTTHAIEREILRLVHNRRIITYQSALYITALAYGINEMFEQSSKLFDELISETNLAILLNNGDENKCRLIPIMHEAATSFLLTGDLLKAEQTVCEAIRVYPTHPSLQAVLDPPAATQQLHHAKYFNMRDLTYIRNLLQTKYELDVQGTRPETKYFEHYLSIFDEDIVGLLLLAEAQLIQESDEARGTLNQALLLLSKYISRAQKDQPTEANKKQLQLVNALTAKTCLHLAKIMANTRDFVDVNKMYKRALSCNTSDKDILYYYACFLVAADKIKDAEKLWSTFSNKEPAIVQDEIQSIALRYLLRTRVSLTEISGIMSVLGL